MPLFLLNIFGWIRLNPLKAVLYALAFVGILYVLSWFACGRSKVKLDERQQQEAARAIEQKNDAKLKEILIEAEVKEAQIDANVANAQAETYAVIQNAKEKYNGMTTDELAAELEKRK